MTKLGLALRKDNELFYIQFKWRWKFWNPFYDREPFLDGGSVLYLIGPLVIEKIIIHQ